MWEFSFFVEIAAHCPFTHHQHVEGEVSLLCASAGGTSPWEFVILLLDIAAEHKLLVFKEPRGLSRADFYCFSSSRISSAGLFALSGFFVSWVIYFPELCGGAKLGSCVLLPNSVDSKLISLVPGFPAWFSSSPYEAFPYSRNPFSYLLRSHCVFS